LWERGTEVRRQSIKPVFSIEYDLVRGDDPFLDIAKCVEYYEKICGELAKA